MRFFALTCHGTGKAENEDRILAGRSLLAQGYLEADIPAEGLLAAVADGVGGRKAGAAASHFVLSALASGQKPPAGGEELTALLGGINDRLLERAARSQETQGMATTLSGLLWQGERLWLFHVGNTRVYVRQGRYLKQLTQDHTKVGLMQRMGLFSRREAEESRERNVITACMGGGDPALLSALQVSDIGEAVRGARLLILTSDGVHEALGPKRLEEILLSERPERERLFAAADAAREAGSSDDISILFASQEGMG